jgi:hypothetical protein
MTLKQALAVAIVIFALAAALCWFRAGVAKVSPEEAHRRNKEDAARRAAVDPDDDWISSGMTVNGGDLAGSLAVQSKWNMRGALAAGLAALAQAA